MKYLRIHELIKLRRPLFFLLILCISIFFLNSCKKEDPIPNRAPLGFSVVAALSNEGTSVKLYWTKAIDPDGDEVSYTIVLDDTLAFNITDTTFNISDVGYDFMKDGKVIANDPAGLSSEARFMVTTGEAPFFEIPDANFETYLVNAKIDKDGVINGKMKIADAKGIKELFPHAYTIKSLDGIEKFTDLEYLECSINSLTKLDLSQNLKLKRLSCGVNNLKVLDLSKNVDLLELNVSNNSIESLDLTNNTMLKRLNCARNQSLIFLDVSKNPLLEYLDCLVCSLQKLDVSKNTKLKYLDCTTNYLSSLELNNNLDLEYLYCFRNQVPLVSLDLCSNSKLKAIKTFSSGVSIIFINVNANINEKWEVDSSTKYEICK